MRTYKISITSGKIWASKRGLNMLSQFATINFFKTGDLNDRLLAARKTR
jgi:hypothetical protein